MRNKSIQKWLIAGVVLIWGFVALRFSGLGESKPISQALAVAKFEIDSLGISADSLILGLAYRDPFLEQSFVSPPQRTLSQSPKRQAFGKAVILKAKPKLHLPKLSYQGLISSRDSLNRTAILLINGRSHTIRPGDQIEGIRINAIEQNSLQIAMADTTINVLR
ncbi:MAG: hypothetical protein AAFN10_17520 [Bacteroidota bacterium]